VVAVTRSIQSGCTNGHTLPSKRHTYCNRDRIFLVGTHTHTHIVPCGYPWHISGVREPIPPWDIKGCAIYTFGTVGYLLFGWTDQQSRYQSRTR
jgi:hypothetical protein